MPRELIHPGAESVFWLKGATFFTVAGPRGTLTLFPESSAHNPYGLVKFSIMAAGLQVNWKIG